MYSYDDACLDTVALQGMKDISIGRLELVEQEYLLLNTPWAKADRKEKPALVTSASEATCINTFTFLLLVQNEINGVNFGPDMTSW